TVHSIGNTVNEINTKVTTLIASEQRHQIEQALATSSTSQTGPSAITEWILPIAKNGHLEDVEAVVLGAINDLTNAGQQTHGAMTDYNSALSAASTGNYKLAFQLLAKAYREANTTP